MTRPRIAALGALALLLAVAPFLPRSGGDEGSLVHAGQEPLVLRPALSAGPSRVTPDLAREIDRVVAQGRATSRVTALTRAEPAEQARALVRCADFEGQRYCLHAGWTTRTQAEVQADAASAAALSARPDALGDAETTGDLDQASSLQQVAALAPDVRAARERRELTDAARAVAKVWLLRHQVEGTPLPDGFLTRHPEARASTSTSTSTSEPSTAAARPKRRKTRADYPRRAIVMKASRVAEQRRSYWCGPATMQMIAWGWTKEKKSQKHWARKLGTTTDGSSISSLARVINRSTGWDRKKRAGKYIVLDIGDYSFKKWLLLNMRHIVDYRAPLVLHPVLHKKYYPYLDDDASGHFQVGRGYDKRGKKPTQVGYFEPWNQQRFDPSEPYIDRVQWRSAYKSYRANQAHFLHNIGV